MIPEKLKYTEEHEWIKLDGDIATIGITDYAQSELGDIVFVELPSLGEIVRKGDVIGTIEAVKTVADIFAPINGEIIEINTEIENNPEHVNSDPYKNGWMIKVKVKDVSTVNELLNSSAYTDLIS
tara:strand:- start:154 stop:528 length:375 start_codon:yes stop_codon:yes gene_type:complete